MTPSLTKIARGLTGARWHVIDYDPAALASGATAQLDRLQSETGENRVLLRCMLKSRSYERGRDSKVSGAGIHR